MANPPVQREGIGPLGADGTSGSPNNNRSPLYTPGPLGTCDLAEQCVDRGVLSSDSDMCIATCTNIYLHKPFLVGLATDNYLTPKTPIVIPDPGLPKNTLRFGQDVEFGVGRIAPKNHYVDFSETKLIQIMRELLDEFASSDEKGMAKRLFDYFLKKHSNPRIFNDKDMNAAIETHRNFLAFSEAVLGAHFAPKKPKLHQILKREKWDINRVCLMRDFAPPAFNLGNKVFGTGDFGNGLGVMINGVQYVLIYVNKYFYDCNGKTYDITLKFVLYDVFGLDDDDLEEYGAKTPINAFDAMRGITAWWYLQHYFGYAPLLTRAEVTREFTNIPAS